MTLAAKMAYPGGRVVTRTSRRFRITSWFTLVVAILGAIAILASAPPAFAQCSASGDVARAISETENVFIGRVTDVTQDGRIAQMKVESIWKGRELPATLEVRGTSQPDAALSSSDRRFELGASYLVIPENSRPPFLATACSATHSFSAVGQLIPVPYQDAVGTSEGRPPASSSGSGAGEAALVASVMPMVAIIAMLIVVLALVTRIRSREPEPVLSTPKPAKPRRLKRRDLARDAAAGVTVAQKLVKKNKRRWRTFRRRQDRQLASSSRSAIGSTETS